MENGENTLIQKLYSEAKYKHTLCVVNTIKKAQELYCTCKDDFECYSLNGYMTDHDKQATVKKIQKRLQQNETKILLISTQSIEAGIDLDFEVGFREVAPISSIIQTAGRINRNFGDVQRTLYIFDDICNYSDLIYGDLKNISQSIFDLLKEKSVQECDILQISDLYFQKIHTQLERYLLEEEIQTLKFYTINQRINNIMNNQDYKQLIIIEPYEGFIHDIETKLEKIKKKEHNKFKKKDFTQGVVRQLLQYGVSVAKKDIDDFSTNIKHIKYLTDMPYLPHGATEYSTEFGIKKKGIRESQEAFS